MKSLGSTSRLVLFLGALALTGGVARAGEFLTVLGGLGKSAEGAERSQRVSVDASFLDTERFSVSLPERSVVVSRQSVAVNSAGYKVWSGSIAGEPLNSATFVESNGRVHGSIRAGNTHYSLEPSAQRGEHRLRRRDLSVLPDCGADALARKEGPPEPRYRHQNPGGK